MLIDGISGSGKSSIVEAIIWVLYGKGRVDSRSLIRNGATKMSVEIVLYDDNDEYRIERKTNNKGKSSLTVGKKTPKGNYLPVKISGNKAVQSYIEKELLRSSYLLFINSIVYPQDNIESFVKQTAAKRKDVILEIANVSDYDEYLEKTKKTINECQTTLIEGNSTILTLNSVIEEDKMYVVPIDELSKSKKETELEIEKLEKVVANLRETEKGYIAIQSKCDSHKTTLSSSKVEFNELNSAISDINQKLIELDDSKIQELENSIEQLPKFKEDMKKIAETEALALEWNKKMMEVTNRDKPIDMNYDEDIEYLNERLIATMKKETFMCPEINKECPHFSKDKNESIKRLGDNLANKQKEKEKFIKDQIVYEQKIAELGQQPEVDSGSKYLVAGQVEKMQAIEIELNELKSSSKANKTILINTLETSNKRLCEVTKSITELENDIAGAAELLKEHDELRDRMISIESNIRGDLTPKLNLINEKISAVKMAEKRTEKNKKKIKEVKKSMEKAEEAVRILKLLKEAFGNNGIKSIVIDYIIPRLEDRINDILSKLSSFSVCLDTQKSSAKGDSTIEGLFITIYNEQNESFDFSSYSGGERLKIVVAISEALAEIQNIGFRVLDELFIGLDEESTEKFADVMAALQERFEQLFCISHLRNIKDMFDKKIEVKKINGISTI